MQLDVGLKRIIESFVEANIDWVSADINNKKLKTLRLDIRKNLCIKEGLSTYKYLEHTTWKPNAEKVCIGIGFNPAKGSPDDVDSTNRKVIKALKPYYDGFILLNLYPLVASSKAEFDESDKRSYEFFNGCVPHLLDHVISRTDVDVLVFWGRTVGVDSRIFERLQTLCENGRLYMTVKKGESIHCHPAYVQIEIQKASKEHLVASYSIR